MAKKIMNDPGRVVPELLDGLLRASGGKIIQVGPVGAIAKATIPNGKVALLIGGGSGHEPLFHGFVGDGMADGAACGNIFAAPTPDVILAVTRALDRGKGVLYLYANYAGDVLNFDMGAELAAEEGISVRTVLIRDDVASAPPDRQELRRGIAGDLFVVKIAGAAASVLDDLDDVVRVTVKARDATRSIGVALHPVPSRRRENRHSSCQMTRSRSAWACTASLASDASGWRGRTRSWISWQRRSSTTSRSSPAMKCASWSTAWGARP